MVFEGLSYNKRRPCFVIKSLGFLQIKKQDPRFCFVLECKLKLALG